MEVINRIKMVLVKKKRTNTWLLEQLGFAPSTILKWCSNSSHPGISNLLKMVELVGNTYKRFIG